jgi:hypothetical protein
MQTRRAPTTGPEMVVLNLEDAHLHPSYVPNWHGLRVVDARCRNGDKRADFLRMDEIASGIGSYVTYWLERFEDDNVIDDYPPATLPPGTLPKQETVKYGTRTYPDLRRLDVRDKWVQLMAAEIRGRQHPTVMHDNIVHPGAGGTHPPDEDGRREFKWPFSWRETTYYLGALQQAVGPETIILPNVAGYAYYWSDEDVRELTGVGGAAFEIPIHPNCRTNPDFMRRQLAAYRHWLSAGMVIAFMDVTRVGDPVEESFYNAALAHMIFEPGDRLWVHWRPTLKRDEETKRIGQPYHWSHWAKLLGPAQANVEVFDDGSAARRYARGTLFVQGRSTVRIELTR